MPLVAQILDVGEVRHGLLAGLARLPRSGADDPLEGLRRLLTLRLRGLPLRRLLEALLGRLLTLLLLLLLGRLLRLALRGLL